LADAEQVKDAAETYIYGYPLVYDLEAVALGVEGGGSLPLQDQLTLTPLSVHQGGTPPAEVAGVPKPDPRVGPELAWWERFRVALLAFPPPAGDKAFLALAERVGATAAESPYVDPRPRVEDGRPVQLAAHPGRPLPPGPAHVPAQQPVLDGSYVLPPVRRVG
jgi:hypothetical protein